MLDDYGKIADDAYYYAAKKIEEIIQEDYINLPRGEWEQKLMLEGLMDDNPELTEEEAIQVFRRVFGVFVRLLDTKTLEERYCKRNQ